VLARVQNLKVHPRMLLRRGQVHHHFDFGVGEQFGVGPVRIRVVGAEGLFVVAEFLEFIALRRGAARNDIRTGDDFDVAEAGRRFQIGPGDHAAADHAEFRFLHLRIFLISVIENNYA